MFIGAFHKPGRYRVTLMITKMGLIPIGMLKNLGDTDNRSSPSLGLSAIDQTNDCPSISLIARCGCLKTVLQQS